MQGRSDLIYLYRSPFMDGIGLFEARPLTYLSSTIHPQLSTETPFLSDPKVIRNLCCSLSPLFHRPPLSTAQQKATATATTMASKIIVSSASRALARSLARTQVRAASSMLTGSISGNDNNTIYHQPNCGYVEKISLRLKNIVEIYIVCGETLQVKIGIDLEMECCVCAVDYCRPSLTKLILSVTVS